jgi:glycosyltransferase involved in cell wall biosynthesis
MKLLQLVEAAAAGVGRHVIDLTEGLLARGHEVHVLYSPLRCDSVFDADLSRLKVYPQLHAMPLRIDRAPAARDFAAMYGLRRYVRRNGPFELVHCHSTKAGIVGRLGLVGHAVKRLYTPHMFYTMDPTRPLCARGAVAALEVILATLGDGVITTSDPEHRHALALGLSPSRLSQVSNGVALPRGTDTGNRQAIRRSLGIDDNDVCIGFIGRLVPAKSPLTMLESFAAHLRRSAARSKLVMVGDGPLASSLQARAESLGIQTDVVWTGARDARPLIDAFDIFALTSDSEGTPLVVLESMARGLPIVSTAVGLVPQAVQPGVNGFLAPVRGVAEIAAALDTLAADAELRRRMGSASRIRAQAFSVDRMVDETISLYGHLTHSLYHVPSPA